MNKMRAMRTTGFFKQQNKHKINPSCIAFLGTGEINNLGLFGAIYFLPNKQEWVSLCQLIDEFRLKAI